MPLKKLKGFYRNKSTGKVTYRKTAVRRAPIRRKPRLRLGYKGTPNTYSFIRETRPTTIDLGATGNGVTLLAGTGAIPDISIFEFPNFSIDQLPGFSEFSNLFANYKIDKIETILIPMWDQTIQQAINPQTGVWSNTGYIPNLVLTRVNTKYLTNGYATAANAETQRDQLAQLQKKTRSMYGNKKWLKINTIKPRVKMEIEDGAGGQNTVPLNSPWLPSVQAADQEYIMNDLMFADKIDGTSFSAGLYKYRMYHRVHFRTSFVG